MAETKAKAKTKPAAPAVRTIRRQLTGEVVSVAEKKTIHVLVKNVKMHPKYRKQYIRSKKYAVHDDAGAAEMGDTVTFEACRPISKTKRWRLISVAV